MLIDRFGRQIDYLRISVTGRCDLHCIYCRPPAEEKTQDEACAEELTVEQIATVARVAGELGVRHVRLTGGEPLMRADLEVLVGKLSAIPEIDDLSMTTNGQLLAERVAGLASAGLQRVNISLDSLDAETYRSLTGGGSLERVWAGIEAAQRLPFSPLPVGEGPGVRAPLSAHRRSGFQPDTTSAHRGSGFQPDTTSAHRGSGFQPDTIKINVVLVRGHNDSEIVQFAELARQRALHVRFIELLPMGPAASQPSPLFYPAAEVLRQLQTDRLHWEDRPGPGPAQVWRLGRGTVGIISSLTNPPCPSCNRLRLTSEGKLRPCLTDSTEIDLRPALAASRPEAAIAEALREAVAVKPAQGAHLTGQWTGGPAMCRVGG